MDSFAAWHVGQFKVGQLPPAKTHTVERGGAVAHVTQAQTTHAYAFEARFSDEKTRADFEVWVAATFGEDARIKWLAEDEVEHA